MPRVRPTADWPRGRVAWFEHESSALRDNPWGDPHRRSLPVYLPPGYEEGGTPYLSLWDLAAFTNAGPGHVNWRNHGENLPRRLDRLIGAGDLPPVVVPMPDAFTSLGGNQYLDSASVGRYGEWLDDELVRWVAERLNVVDHVAGRALFGKSSGGYGALVRAMQRPDTWGGAAAHAPDVGFEWVYRPGFGTTQSVLARYGDDPVEFLRRFWRMNRPRGHHFHALLTVAMAATYDPQPGGDIRLPYDSRTLAMDEQAWACWLANDPLHLAERHAGALRGLAGLWLDAGDADQYLIQYGARALHDRLEALTIDHHYEEFEGTHSGIDWRLDHSLPWMAKRLLAACDTHDIDARN